MDTGADTGPARIVEAIFRAESARIVTALTRRVKAAGPTWQVQEKRGRKIFSRGLWCSSADVAKTKTFARSGACSSTACPS